MSQIPARNLASLALAAAAAFASASASQAASFSGFTIAPGINRVVTTVNQNSTSASNATCALAVRRWSGVTEYPVFTVISPSTCIAYGPDYQIVMTNVGANLTNVLIQATAPTCSLKWVRFGNSVSKCGFDLTNPITGTVNSSTGRNPVPMSMGGAWNTSIHFDNAVKYAATAAVGDLFSRMTVSFSSPFSGTWQFDLDTDLIG